MKYIYNLLLVILYFCITYLVNKVFLLNKFFLSVLAFKLKKALWIIEALSFSFCFNAFIIFFHLFKYLPNFSLSFLTLFLLLIILNLSLMFLFIVIFFKLFINLWTEGRLRACNNFCIFTASKIFLVTFLCA